MVFDDRADAGRQLAAQVLHLRPELPVVLGLPRGGVPVALEVARALEAPLDIVVVRRLPSPFHGEIAMGAVGEGGVVVVNETVVRDWAISREQFCTVARAAQIDVELRARQLRQSGRVVPMRDQTALLVDDGAATGATARAACQVARAAGAQRVVLALPVASQDAVAAVQDVVDELICVHVPEVFLAVGQWYADFTPVSDDEVRAALSSRLPELQSANGWRLPT